MTPCILEFMARNWKKVIVVLLALSIVGIFNYLNQLIYNYQVPPGGDAVQHIKIVNTILEGNFRTVTHFHFVWHLVTAGIIKLTQANGIVVVAWTAPALVVLGSLGMFIFNRRFFGFAAGIASLLLLGLFSLQPFQTLYDGGFPNFLAATLILPLALVFLDRIFTSKNKLVATAVAGILLGILLFTHNVTSLYGLSIIAVSILIYLPIYLRRRGLNYFICLLSIPTAMFLAVLTANMFFNSNSTSASGLATSFARVDWSWPYFHLVGELHNPNAFLDVTAYPEVLGLGIVYLGIAGLVVALIHILIDSTNSKARGSIFLIVWAGLIFALSQRPEVGFPVRLTRDLAVPLVLMGGVIIQAIVDVAAKRQIPIIFTAVIVLLCFGFSLPTLLSRYQTAISPNPLIYHKLSDDKMAKWINENVPKDSYIAVFSGDAYLPLFVAERTVDVEVPESVRLNITNPKNLPSLLPEADYIYIQYRKDLPQKWDNTPSLVKSYLSGSNVELAHSEKQTEEEVYLFKVLKSKLIKR